MAQQRQHRQPSLAHEVLLLALRDNKPREIFERTFILRITVSAASLLDLFGGEFLTLSSDGTFTLNRTESECPILESVLRAIRGSKEQRSLDDWLMHLATRPSDLLECTIDDLIRTGVYEIVSRRRLGIFRSRVLATPDHSLALERKRRMQEILDGSVPLPRERLVLRVIGICEIIDVVFDSSHHNVAQQRIVEIGDSFPPPAALAHALTQVKGCVRTFVERSRRYQ